MAPPSHSQRFGASFQKKKQLPQSYIGGQLPIHCQLGTVVAGIDSIQVTLSLTCSLRQPKPISHLCHSNFSPGGEHVRSLPPIQCLRMTRVTILPIMIWVTMWNSEDADTHNAVRIVPWADDNAMQLRALLHVMAQDASRG